MKQIRDLLVGENDQADTFYCSFTIHVTFIKNRTFTVSKQKEHAYSFIYLWIHEATLGMDWWRRRIVRYHNGSSGLADEPPQLHSILVSFFLINFCSPAFLQGLASKLNLFETGQFASLKFCHLSLTCKWPVLTLSPLTLSFWHVVVGISFLWVNGLLCAAVILLPLSPSLSWSFHLHSHSSSHNLLLLTRG